MFVNKYPYTDIHELNLDWLLGQMLQLRTDMKDFINQNVIKYADPIQWNITTQYEANTVVIEPNSGNAYISSQPVPAGVAISNTDYWSVIGNFSILYESIKESIAAADDGSNINATEARTEGQLLWLNSKLYKVLSDISVGALYITSGTGQNLQEVTIEELLNTETIERQTEVSAINSSILNIQGNINTINSSILNIQGSVDNIVGYIGIDPDSFEGTDIQKIQAAYDAAVAYINSHPTNVNILIKREYDLTGGTVEFHYPETSQINCFIKFIGINKGGFYQGGTDSPYMFKCRDGSGINTWHGFYNLHFRGAGMVRDNRGILDDTVASNFNHARVFNMVRFNNIKVIGCQFTFLSCVYDNRESTATSGVGTYTVYSAFNTYYCCSDVAYLGRTQNAITFLNDYCALGYRMLTATSEFLSLYTLNFINCTIEYLSGFGIQLPNKPDIKGIAGVNIKNCYLEGIKDTALALLTAIQTLVIDGNTIQVSGNQITTSIGLFVAFTGTNKIAVTNNQFILSTAVTNGYAISGGNSGVPSGTKFNFLGTHVMDQRNNEIDGINPSIKNQLILDINDLV